MMDNIRAIAITMANRLALLVTVGSLVYCTQDKTASNSRFITEQAFACHKWDAKRVAEIKNGMPENFVTGFSPANEELIFQALAGIPNPYLEYLFSLAPKGFHIENSTSLGNVGNGVVIGLTHISYSAQNEFAVAVNGWPTKMLILDRGPQPTATTQHELGHANMGFVFRAKSDPNSALMEYKNVANAEAGNPQLNGYPKSAYAHVGRDNDMFGKLDDGGLYRSEFFAEAFNSYYCSEESKQALTERFKSAGPFFSELLLPPVWEDGQQGDIGGGGGQSSGSTGGVSGGNSSSAGNASGGGNDTGTKNTPTTKSDTIPKLKFALSGKEVTEGGYRFYISSNLPLKKSSYCLGSSKSCADEGAEWFKTVSAKGRGQAIVYQSSGSIVLKDGFCITIGGQAQESQRWGFRTIRLTRSGSAASDTAKSNAQNCTN